MTFLLALACLLAIEGPGVSGQVVDAESKQPVAGAVIRVITETPRQGRLEFECTTDAGGRFRLDLPRAGTYRMGIEGPEGYLRPNESLPEASMGTIRVGETLEDLGEQPIWPVGTIRGEVHLPDGTPVQEGHIRLVSAECRSIGSHSNRYDIEEGAFRMFNLGPGTYRIEAEAEGYSRSSLLEVEVGPREVRTVELSLRPPSRVEGQLRWADEGSKQILHLIEAGDGQSSGSSSVSLDGRSQVKNWLPGEHLAIAPRSGRFRFEDITAARYELFARDLAPGALAVVEVRPGESASIEVDATPRRVRLVIHDDQDQPVPGVELVPITPFHDPRFPFMNGLPASFGMGGHEPPNKAPQVSRWETDAEGAAVLECFLATPLKAVISRPGMVSRLIELTSDDPLVVVMSRTRVIDGRLFDPAGQPLADAQVNLSWRDLGTSMERREVVSDEQGVFQVEGLPDREVFLSVYGNGDRIPFSQVIDMSGTPEPRQVDIRLKEGAFVNCRVVDREGAPVEDAYIRCPECNWTGQRTDAEGSARLGPLVEGMHQLEALVGWDSRRFEIEVEIRMNREESTTLVVDR